MVGHAGSSRQESRSRAPAGDELAAPPGPARCAAWSRATLDAAGEGYMVWGAVRDGHAIVDWVVLDANAIAVARWSDAVGTLIGATASRLNEVADNTQLLEVLRDALEHGERRTADVRLTLPGGRGGWRRMIATPVDLHTVSVVTRDISRERYLERALERERREQPAVASQDANPQAQFAARTAALLYVG